LSNDGLIVSYAQLNVEPRRWCRSAVKALAWVVASPILVALPLLYAADNHWLPQHFLCCYHPEVAVLAFTVMPLVGSVWGGMAVTQIIRETRRPRSRGMTVACLAMIGGGVLALSGMGVVFGLKA